MRLWFASFAYVLICALRRLGLAHIRLANASCGAIRLKLIGAQVRVSVRRIKVAMASAVPMPRSSPWLTPEYVPRLCDAAGPEPFCQCRSNFPQKCRSKIPQFRRSDCRGGVSIFRWPAARPRWWI
ncbi:transposase [Mesorhizobium sp. M0074]